MIVNYGKDTVLYLLKGDQATKGYPTHLAVGDDNTEESASQTSLGNQIGSRVAVAYIVDEPNKKITFRATFTFSGSGTIREVGLFNGATGNNMFARIVVTDEPVVDGSMLTFDYIIYF